MAQKVHIILEDDIDGGDATQTIQFGLDGAAYEIDLNDKNAGALRKALTKYVEHGRRVKGKVRGTSSKVNGAKVNGTRVTLEPSTKEIRHWAQGQGLDVPARGRIPNAVREQFDAAH